MEIGGLMLLGMAVFALITLPIERNASTRAVHLLERSGLITEEERSGVWAVLRAAAFTYLAESV